MLIRSVCMTSVDPLTKASKNFLCLVLFTFFVHHHNSTSVSLVLSFYDQAEDSILGFQLVLILEKIAFHISAQRVSQHT